MKPVVFRQARYSKNCANQAGLKGEVPLFNF